MPPVGPLIDAFRRDFAPPAPAFTPMRVLEVEISRPLPDLAQEDAAQGKRYTEAFIVVRLFTKPLGILELALPPGGLPATALAHQIWQRFAQTINERLLQEGLAEIAALESVGLPDTGLPASLGARRAFLAEAPFVSVIISTRNRAAQLARCLRSLLALDYPDFEIIVVDNAPTTDETAKLIAEGFGDEQRIRYVLERYPGLSMARTRGLVEARGAIVAFADDDVVVDQHWLTALTQGFQVDTDVACVTGLVLPMEIETPAQGWIKEFGNLNKGFTQGIFDLAEHRVDETLYPYVSWKLGAGASMAFQAQTLREIGGFDPLLGTGGPAYSGEEMSAYFQLLVNGYRIVYEPGAILYHLDYRDYASLRRQTYGYGVGLIPYLLKCLRDNPRLFADFLVKIPVGMWNSRNVISQMPVAMRKWEGYTRDLMLVRRKGMLYGPLAFYRSWRQVRRLRGTFGEPALDGPAPASAEDAARRQRSS